MEQPHAFDIQETTEQETSKNGQITKQARVWQAYKQDEEILHLKPSTWIAMVAVFLSVLGVIFGSGVTVSRMVTKQEFKQGLKELKLELKQAINKGAVSRIEYERLKTEIRLLQQKVDLQGKHISRQQMSELLKALRRKSRRKR